MLYRQSVTWPCGDQDETEIRVAFVREHAHGDEYGGADNDGEVVVVPVVDRELADALRFLQESGAIRWPSPDRAAVYDRIFAAAELAHAGKGTFAKEALSPFLPTENFLSMHDVDSAHVTDEGETVDNSAIMDAREREMTDEEFAMHRSLRDRATALLLTKRPTS